MGKEWDKADTFPLRDRGKLNGTSVHAPHAHERGFANGMHVDNSTRARDAFITFLREVMAEALRVLKPGGHAFVWALPRTSHWTGMALEDAGFEIRDVITHLFGSGFPKSHDISAAIDKMQGAEREVIGFKLHARDGDVSHQAWTIQDTNQNKSTYGEYPGFEKKMLETAPATPEASQWDGWGTALKPASEHWYLVRKPLSEKSIAENVLKWGTGALAIDKCRVGNESTVRQNHAPRFDGSHYNNGKEYNIGDWQSGSTQGRWPSNLLLSHSVWCVPNGVKKVKGTASGYNWEPSNNDNPTHIARNIKSGMHYGDEEVEDWLCDESCPVRLLDEQSGMRKSDSHIRHNTHVNSKSRGWGFKAHETTGVDDTGGASRYFQRFTYSPKASRAERNRGCEGLPSGKTFDKNTSKRIAHINHETGETTYNDYQPSANSNTHPTVKSIALMRYLVRMITPPDGIVLDCFAGSGSTLVAAIHEGMHFIGIEMNDTPEEPYVTIARARIEQAFREVQS